MEGCTVKKTLALVLLLTLVFCATATAESYKIGMLPKFKGENYFDGCYVGAAQAAKDLGVELVYDGPNQSEATNAKQVEILTGWLSADFDAIVVSPCDAEGLAPTLREFQKAGVLVLTFDADTATDARSFYVNPATAKDIAVGLVDVIANGLLAGGVFGEGTPARLALISGSGLDVNQNEWILAIEAYLASTYPWITVKSDEVGYLGPDIWTPGSDETAAQNAANEAIALSGDATDGSQINAVIGTSSMSTPALAAAWNAIVGEKPNVVITGLATPLGIVDYILDEANPMKYGVLWDVGNLGYLSVEAAVKVLDGTLSPAEGVVFASNRGDKNFVINADDGGLELLLGAALTFGPDNIANFNY
jgi:rhamnose transport system substrate-binding protein